MPDVYLIDLVREPWMRDSSKHGLSEDHDAFADEQINAMTNIELVQAISYAVDQLIALRVAQAVAAARADFPSSENP